jgi:hypothetical protein
MEKVSIQSTSHQSAICSDLVLREGELVRLIFRPAIVDNSTEPAACVRGHLIYQKKGKKDVWADVEPTSLSSLKKGEQYRLELHAGELLLLLKHLAGLYKIHRKDGVPQGYSEYVKLESQLGELVKASEPDLAALLTTNPHDALTTLHRVLNWQLAIEKPRCRQTVRRSGDAVARVDCIDRDRQSACRHDDVARQRQQR